MKNTILGIINGDVSNGFRKNELFDANAVMDQIHAISNKKVMWELVE